MTERKTVRRWWSSVTINRTEFWLTEMAEQGWALEDIQDNRFVFQKAEPQYREYFLPCLGWRYGGKVAERLSRIDIFCNARYGTDPRMKRRSTMRFIEIDVSKVDQNIAPLYQKRYRICRNEHLGFLGLEAGALAFYFFVLGADCWIDSPDILLLPFAIYMTVRDGIRLLLLWWDMRQRRKWLATWCV